MAEFEVQVSTAIHLAGKYTMSRTLIYKDDKIQTLKPIVGTDILTEQAREEQRQMLYIFKYFYTLETSNNSV